MRPEKKKVGVGPCHFTGTKKGLPLCPVPAKSCGDNDTKFIECAEYAIILKKNIRVGCWGCGRVEILNEGGWHDLLLPPDIWDSIRKIPRCPICLKEVYHEKIFNS